MPEKQTEKLNKMLWEYIRKIEQEKLFYFMLAYHNSPKVLIVKSPADSKEQKQFLGYEWTNAMGNEGIKYNNGETVYDINTPLFNPNDRNDQTKISYLIQQNFLGQQPLSPQGLQALAGIVSYANLTDLLDFSRKDFNKSFSLTPKNMKPIATKWDYIKVADAFLEVKNGKSVNQTDEVGKYKVSRIETIATASFDANAVKYTNDNVKEEDFLQKGDILFSHINSVQHLAKTAVFDLDEKIVHGINLLKFRPNPAILLPKYAAEIFKHTDFTNEIKAQAQKAINQASVNTSYLNDLKIPLPPLEIQEKIVLECEAIDKAVEKAKSEAEKAKKEIEEKIKTVFETVNKDKIENLNKLLKRGKSTQYGNSKIQVIKSGQARGYTTFDFTEKYFAVENFQKDERLLQNGDLLINSTGVGTAGRVTLFELAGEFVADSHITIFRPNEKILAKFALHSLAYIGFKTIEKMAKGSTGQIELSLSIIGDIQIPVPPLSTQETLVSEIEKLELQIAENQGLINGAKVQKEAVLKRYL